LDKLFVMQEAWDHLIVLDACRYDFMERLSGRYIEGNLGKRLSAGTSTLEWRDANFQGRYEDVVYVSSNPYINGVRAVRGFLGSEHFGKVYDVWSTAWNRKKGTVLPKAVSDCAVGAMKNHGRARFIIHYLQPHAPYLGLDDDTLGFPIPDVECERVLTGTSVCEDPATKVLILKALTRVCYKARLLGSNPAWRLREILRMDPASPMDAVRRASGDTGLRAAYEANLETVLAAVADLLRFMSGRIVITSDHGELLGEGGRYSHFSGSTARELLEIPWLVVEKRQSEALDGWRAERKDEPEAEGADGKDEIGSRLRALGYID
jgi:arylsulfatase A-like enzyme